LIRLELILIIIQNNEQNGVFVRFLLMVYYTFIGGEKEGDFEQVFDELFILRCGNYWIRNLYCK